MSADRYDVVRGTCPHEPDVPHFHLSVQPLEGPPDDATPYHCLRPMAAVTRTQITTEAPPE